jgi:hypothetical protein
MSRHTASQAELEFLHTLSSEGPFEKDGEDLDPETIELLELKNVSPATLDQLEEQASAEPAVQEPTPPAQPLSSEDAEPEVVEKAPEPELPNRLTHGKLFTYRRAHPLQILEVLGLRYKTNWPDWEPETLWWAMRRDYGPVGEIARNKIGALRIAVISDMPWQDFDTFENCADAWNDLVPIFGAFNPVSPMQAALAVSVLRGIRPDEEFGYEVSAYIAAILEEHGWVLAPEEWFPGAQAILDRRDYLLPFKADVEEAWGVVENVPPEEIEYLEDEMLDVHLLKLAVVKRYLEERAMLQEQVLGSATTSLASPPVP